MFVQTLSTCILTDKIDASRDFYTHYFAAEIVFDCGWYVNLRFGHNGASVQFMSPQQGQSVCNTEGLTYNFCVEDVDAEHDRLCDAGLPILMPLADHPWGDRGFAVQDPNGVMLYIYSDREPSDEFKSFYKDVS